MSVNDVSEDCDFADNDLGIVAEGRNGRKRARLNDWKPGIGSSTGELKDPDDADPNSFMKRLITSMEQHGAQSRSR